MQDRRLAAIMFSLLGTPENDKKLVLHDSDHLVPIEVLVSETLHWLDHQFGKIDFSIEMQRLREPEISCLHY